MKLERGEQRDREKRAKMELRRQKSITRYYSLRQKSRNNFLLDLKYGELELNNGKNFERAHGQ